MATIKLSKQQWEFIGNQTGWLKTEEAKKKEKSPREHGFVDQCVKKNKSKVDDAGAYCASIVDKVKGTTKWRKGPKKD